MTGSDVRPLRVAVIVELSPDDAALSGGTVGFVRAIRPWLPRQWRLFCPEPCQRADEGAGIDDSTYVAPPIRRGIVPRRITFPLWIARAAPKFAAFDADLYYSHSNEAAAALLAMMKLGRLPPRPIALHQHGGDNPVENSTYRWARRLLPRVYAALLNATMRRCAKLVAIDEKSAALGAALGLADRTIRMANGVDVPDDATVARLRASGRRSLGIDERTFVFFHAGRLEAVKQQDALLAAFECLRGRSGAPMRLVIAGEGTLALRLREQIARMVHRDDVAMLGNVGGARMVELHAAADAFVLCSKLEGVPMVLLEAMACGTPFVAPPVGGIADLVHHDNGLLLPVGWGRDELAAAMDVATTRDWCRARIRERAAPFSAGAQVHRLELEFDAVVSRARSAAR
ncbi:MAG TPA: glycosyltransferase family 4 protein [Pseudomonadales bacterium]|nr:glycosyltransferase family 4 protein [Pseudomonadales bacterium]